MITQQPGFYLISFWYKREESQKRFAVFWCSVLIAGAFGGLLASAIATMDGIGGLENWRWIFILEGLGTLLVGGMAFFLITDFPEQASWVTEEERDFIIQRTGHVDNAPTHAINLRDVAWFFKSPKRILGAFMYWGEYAIHETSTPLMNHCRYSGPDIWLVKLDPEAVWCG